MSIQDHADHRAWLKLATSLLARCINYRSTTTTYLNVKEIAVGLT